MDKKRFLTVTLLSITTIALEMAWTRILSAEFFYTFAFLVLSLAILGLGMGALSLRLFPKLNRESVLGLSLSLSGLMTLISPIIVFKIGLKFSELFNSWLMVGKLLLTVILLSSAFYFAGIALSMIFRKHNRDISKLYMADLIGAGIGVLLAILMMNLFGTPKATFLIALPIMIAALLTSRKWIKTLPAILIIVTLILSRFAPGLLEAERQERAPVIYKHWDAMSKIKVMEYPGGNSRGIQIDNVANTPVYKFDGNWDRPDSMKFEFGIPVNYLIRQFDDCTFLSLGAGGGMDVLQALQEGATEIHAVEVNPWINKLMLEGDPKGYIKNDSVDYATLDVFSGHIYKDPRVTVATEDARAYVKRFRNKFDVIYSLSSNSWAALASGSFSLAENYLFTTEAFRDYWNALSEEGFMMMEHQFYMPRLVSDVKNALTKLGVENPTDHFAVYNLPKMRRNALLLSKRMLTDEIRYHAIHDLTPEHHPYIHLLYPPADSLKQNVINQIVENGWETVADSVTFDISPNTDNRPFVAQMGMWKNFTKENLKKILPYEFFGFPLTKIIILIILAVVIVLIIPLNLLPYLKKGKKLKAKPWLYFFTIGMAFMIVEVILIQQYTLFVGPSVYSIATILLTLLAMSGVGSRFSGKFCGKAPFIGIIIWLLCDILLFTPVTNLLFGLTQGPRILITALLVTPLGFFMGMPFPKGSLKVGELVDWGFAVNGAASVLGSTLIILVVITWGFNAGLALGGLLYLAAFGLLNTEKGW